MPEDYDAGQILEASCGDEVKQKLQAIPAAVFLFVSVNFVLMV